MAEVSLTIRLKPYLDESFARVTTAMKSTLESLGGKISPIDEAKFKSALQTIQTESKKVENELDDINTKTKKIGDTAEKASSGFASIKNVAAGIMMATGLQMGLSTVVNGFQDVIAAGAKYQSSLAEVESITGVSGNALQNMGKSARALSLEFGGTAVTQLDSYKGILSRLGSDIGKSPEALDRMTRSVNTLSAASGLDAVQSMDALTTAALQFNVDLSNPIKAAEKMASMMNVMAAGAKEGASEIPQVSQAIVAAGSAANLANMSFEETNAAIQVIAAKAGKYGSEAGTGLRNVISLLQKNSKEAQDITASIGLPFEKLGQTLNTQGLAPALQLLKQHLETIQEPAKRNAAIFTIFGQESAAVASGLMNGAEMLADFTHKMTGTQTAVEQAAIRQNTLTAQWERFKAQISDFGLSAFQLLTPVISGIFTAIQSVTTGVGSAFKFISDNSKTFTPVFIGLGAAIIGVTVALHAKQIADIAVAASTAILNTAEVISINGMYALATATWAALAPLLPFIGVAAALGVGIYALAGGFSKSSQEKLNDLEASKKLIEEDKKLNNEKQEQIRGNLDIIRNYELLSEKKNRTADDDKRLNEMVEKLNKAYPQLTLSLEDHNSNLEKIKNAAGITNVEYSKLTDNTKKLIVEFENLSKKENLSAEEKKRLNSIMADLHKIYPDVSLDTNNLSGSLQNLQSAAGLSNKQLQDLQKELAELDEQSRKLELGMIAMKANVAKDKAYDAVNSLLSIFVKISSTASAGFAGVIEAMFSRMYQAAKSMNYTELNNASRKFQEWIKSFEGQNEDKLKAIESIRQFKNALKMQISAFSGQAEIKTSITTEFKCPECSQKFKTQDELNEHLKTHNKKPITGEVKYEYSDIFKEIEKLEEEYNQKSLESSTELIDEKRRREFEKIQDTNTKELAANKEKIDKIRERHDKELEDGFIYTESQEADFQKRILALEKKGIDNANNIKLAALKKYYETVFNEDIKSKTDLLQNEVDLIQKRINLQESSQQSLQGGAYIKNLEQSGDLKIQLLKKQNQKEIEELLSKNDAYRQAQQDLIKAQTEGYDPYTIAQYQYNLNKIRADVIVNDPAIIIANQQLNLNIEKAEQESSDNIRSSKINMITDLAVRSREIAIFEAEKQYRDELQKAQGNEALMLDAYKIFLLAKAKAEEDYLNKTNALYRIAQQFQLDVAVSCQEALQKKKDENAIKDLESQDANNRKELADLQKQLYNKEISTKAYYKRAKELHEQHNKIEEDLAKANASAQAKFYDIMTESAIKSLQKLQVDSINDLKIYSDNHLAIVKALAHNKIDIKQNESAIMKAAYEGDYSIIKNNLNKMADLMKNNAKNTEAYMASWTASVIEAGNIMGATMGIMVLQHQSFVKSFVTSSLSALKALVPIFIAEIYGEYLATMGPLGIVLAGVATATLQALLTVAESAMANAKFAQGGLIQGGRQVIQVNEEGEEFVVNASATKKIGKDLLQINAENTTIEEHIRIHRHDLIKKFYSEAILNKGACSLAQIGIYNTNTGASSLVLSDELKEKLIRQQELDIASFHLQREKIENYIINDKFNRDNIAKAIEKQTDVLQAEIKHLKEDLKKSDEKVSRFQRELKIKMHLDGKLEADSGSIIAEINSAKRRELSLR